MGGYTRVCNDIQGLHTSPTRCCVVVTQCCTALLTKVAPVQANDFLFVLVT